MQAKQTLKRANTAFRYIAAKKPIDGSLSKLENLKNSNLRLSQTRVILPPQQSYSVLDEENI